MNTIKATVSTIERLENLTAVTFDASGQTMRMVGLEQEERLNPGSRVLLGIKATNIALAKALNGRISISNRLECSVEAIEIGEILCRVRLAFSQTHIESIITKESALYLGLQTGDRVTALIKASELSIAELLD